MTAMDHDRNQKHLEGVGIRRWSPLAPRPRPSRPGPAPRPPRLRPRPPIMAANLWLILGLLASHSSDLGRCLHGAGPMLGPRPPLPVGRGPTPGCLTRLRPSPLVKDGVTCQSPKAPSTRFLSCSVTSSRCQSELWSHPFASSPKPHFLSRRMMSFSPPDVNQNPNPAP